MSLKVFLELDRDGSLGNINSPLELDSLEFVSTEFIELLIELTEFDELLMFEFNELGMLSLLPPVIEERLGAGDSSDRSGIISGNEGLRAKLYPCRFISIRSDFLLGRPSSTHGLLRRFLKTGLLKCPNDLPLVVVFESNSS